MRAQRKRVGQGRAAVWVGKGRGMRRGGEGGGEQSFHESRIYVTHV